MVTGALGLVLWLVLLLLGCRVAYGWFMRQELLCPFLPKICRSEWLRGLHLGGVRLDLTGGTMPRRGV